MPKIKVLPHATVCPQGAEIEGVVGKSICDNLLDNHIDIEHACEKQAACTTCHVILRQGFDSLEPAEEKSDIERPMAALEKALGASDHRAIKQAIDALNRATEPFAERRMDEGIRRALAGKKIGSL